MIKFNLKNISKRTFELCQERAINSEYKTAPLTIYSNIRSAFTYNKSKEFIINLGYNKELVGLIYNETFKK